MKLENKFVQRTLTQDGHKLGSRLPDYSWSWVRSSWVAYGTGVWAAPPTALLYRATPVGCDTGTARELGTKSFTPMASPGDPPWRKPAQLPSDNVTYFKPGAYFERGEAVFTHIRAHERGRTFRHTSLHLTANTVASIMCCRIILLHLSGLFRVFFQGKKL